MKERPATSPEYAAPLSISSALLAEIQAAADEEHRSAQAVLQDAMEVYLRQRRREEEMSATEREVMAATRTGRQPTLRRTPAEAAARMLARRPLRRLPEGETVRSMIEYGRA
jgi:hypothetical protein